MTRASRSFEPVALDDFEELLADQPDDERWELIGGRVVRMMVGVRWEHNRIIANISAGLDARFRASGSPCRTLSETFRLKEEASRSFLFPDILVHCRRLSPGATFVSDASAIIEVMSGGTVQRDRREKWAIYQTLQSLKHYVLVQRDAPHVEVFDRTGDDWDGLRIIDGLHADLALESLSVALPIHEIYADVL